MVSPGLPHALAFSWLYWGAGWGEGRVAAERRVDVSSPHDFFTAWWFQNSKQNLKAS